MGIEKDHLKCPVNRVCKACGSKLTDGFEYGGPMLYCEYCDEYTLYHMEEYAIELRTRVDSIISFDAYEDYLKAMLMED